MSFLEDMINDIIFPPGDLLSDEPPLETEFHLRQLLQPNEQQWLWSEQLELYLGIYNSQLRFFTPLGELLPTAVETAEIEKQRADAEVQRAEQERLQKEELEALLRQYQKRFGELT